MLQQVAEQLGIDSSFYYLFGLIVGLYFFLSFAYLRPFQKLLEQRRARTEGTKEDAADLIAKADEIFNQYKARLKQVNDEARQILRDGEAVARKEEAQILDAASQKSKAALQDAVKELEGQRRAAVESLGGSIIGLAGDIATKVLGRQVSAK